MPSFWDDSPTFPIEVVFGYGNDAVTAMLYADGTFQGDPAAMRRAMECARGGERHAAVLAWLVLRAMEKT